MPNQFALKIPGLSGTPSVDIPNPTGFRTEFTDLSSIVTQAIPILFSVAGIILLVFLLLGGFDYLTAMGDPKKAASGRQKITYAILGFIIIFVSFWLVQIIDYIFKLGVYNPVASPLTPTPT